MAALGFRSGGPDRFHQIDGKAFVCAELGYVSVDFFGLAYGSGLFDQLGPCGGSVKSVLGENVLAVVKECGVGAHWDGPELAVDHRAFERWLEVCTGVEVAWVELGDV